jgi:hypothetical protein
MNAKTNSRKWSWTQLNERRAARTAMLLLLLLLTLPAVVRAQSYTDSYGTWYYTTTNDSITITEYSGPGGDVTIPDRIPDTINGLPVTSIGGYYDPYGNWFGAFSGCSALTSVTIPNSVTSIGDFAFENSGLTSVTIPNSVTNIGSGAFSSCSGLTSVTIPNSVTSIGDGAFGDCYGLTAITVDALNSCYSSVAGVLFNKNQTTLIQCPEGKVGSYTIPNSVTSIGDNAFSGCSGLTSVTIPNSVTSIGSEAFVGCTNLTSVTIPNSVTSIGVQAFGDFSGLTSVTIGNSVTSIGVQAFGDCSGLTSVTIPNSVTSIGNDAFSECFGLTSVTIGTSVTSIGSEAFWDCSSLTSVTIPNSVTSIGSDAFYACTSLTAAYFQGNAPPNNGTAFYGDSKATVYYLPGTTGWGAMFGSRPTALWALPYPVILSGANGNTNLGVQNNQFGFTISWANNVPVVVLAATNLANPVWTPVSTNALTNGAFYFNDPQWTNYPARFYRVRSP